jgi:hypothetical protein
MSTMRQEQMRQEQMSFPVQLWLTQASSSGRRGHLRRLATNAARLPTALISPSPGAKADGAAICTNFGKSQSQELKLLEF